jgi:hypothetical protein
MKKVLNDGIAKYVSLPAVAIQPLRWKALE